MRGPQTAPSRIIDEAELLATRPRWLEEDGVRNSDAQRHIKVMSCGVEGRKTAHFDDSMDLILADCADFSEIRHELVYPPLVLVPTRYNYEELRTNVPRWNGRFVL